MNSFTLRSSERWVLHGDVSPDVLNKFAYLGRKLSWEHTDISQKEFIDFIELIPTNSDIKHIPLIIKELSNLKKIIIPTCLCRNYIMKHCLSPLIQLLLVY